MMSQTAEEYVFNETGCLTFEALENTVITLIIQASVDAASCPSVSYTIDGINWVTTENVSNSAVTITSPEIKKGRKISWKASGNRMGVGPNSTQGSNFSSTGKVNVYGHLTSMTGEENTFSDTITGTYAFRGLFSTMKIVSAGDLILPTNTLTATYRACFDDCTELVTAPTIPPMSTAGNGAFVVMFRGCSKLSYIKALFTFTPTQSTNDRWVQNVPASGTFIKNSAAQWDVVGTNGVPSGWTIEYETA